jgi:glutamine amidotransferase PdxT
MSSIIVGVLALQGAFYEHIQLLKKAATALTQSQDIPASQWEFIEVRTRAQLDRCNALILPGGESTTISLVAASSNLLEPLRDFVKYTSSPVDVCGSITDNVFPGQTSSETNMGNLRWLDSPGRICESDEERRTRTHRRT